MENLVQILVIEDDKEHIELIKAAFKTSGQMFELHIAETLSETKEFLAEHTPALIIADWELPDGVGIDLLKDKQLVEKIPIALITSFGNESYAVEAIKAGAMDYLPKSAQAFLNLPLFASRILREWQHIIERRNLERLQISTELKFRNFIENSTTGFMMTDETGAIIEWNEAMTKITNLTKPDIAQLSIDDVYNKIINNSTNNDFINSLTNNLQSALETGASIIFNRIDELKLHVGENAVKYVENNFFPIKTSNGWNIGCTLLDITEHKKIAQQDYLKSKILDLVSDTVFLTDFTGNIHYVNDSITNSHGYSKSEIVKMKMRDISISEQDCGFDQVFADISKNVETTHESIHRTKNGKLISMEVSTRAVNIDGTQYMLCVARDISERKKMEHELIDTKEKAEQSDKLKTLFLQNISHEVRTPLNAIIGFSELLTSVEKFEDLHRQYLNIIQQRGYDLLEIITKVMEISKLETGEVTIKETAANIDTLLNRLNTFVTGKLISENKTHIKYRVKNLLTNNFIVADIDCLYQILMYMVENAIKFTNHGYVELGLFLRDGETLQFYVTDTGIGIPPDKLPVIFERFRQVDDSASRKFGGVGLGLAIAKGLVEQMHGKIWVHTQQNQGSTFFFTIPYKTFQETTIQITTSKIKKNYDWSGKQILIVEDDYSSYKYIDEVLRKTKVGVKRAANGIEAYEMCLENNFNLVLMDLQLPDMNGFEATELIKHYNSKILVIAQTAFVSPDDRKRCIEAGCDDFLAKPVNSQKLLSMIEKYFDGNN